MQYTIPKGVFDIVPQDPDPKGLWRESHRWRYVIDHILRIATDYGFKEIQTPIFEKAELFARSVGENTDIVSKEMFLFHDKADRKMALRPEGTAPVMRAVIEKNLYIQNSLSKFFYIGPMFRYERQQAGRYRQHHQLGIEAIGEASPEQDAEVIDFLYSLYMRLGIKGLKIHLNSIGDVICRSQYKTSLVSFLTPYTKQLSEDSQLRLITNPLRILDSKAPEDRHILQSAPSILEFLEPEAKAHFTALQSLLTDLSLPFTISDHLVRGLDYYNRTVFEITSGDLGAQNTIGAGGRYDGLIKTLGGPDLPAVGFGTGLERIIQTMLAQNCYFPDPKTILLYVIPLGDQARKYAFSLIKELRMQSIAVEMNISDTKLKSAMKQADKLKARYVAIIGEEELANNTLQLKDMLNRSSESITLDKLKIKLNEVKDTL